MTALFLILAASFYASVNPFSEKTPKIILPGEIENIDDANASVGGETNGGLDKNEYYYKSLDINKENVITVVDTIKRPNTYSCEITSVIYYGGNSSEIKRLCYIDGEYAKTEVLGESGMPKVHVVTGREYSFIWKAGDAKYYTGRTGEISADDVQAIPTYEEVLSLPAEKIKKAEYTTFDDLGCVYIEYEDEITGYCEKYWISTDSGLLVKSQTLDREGELIYETGMDKLKYEVNSEVFRLADGKMAQEAESVLLSDN